MKKKINKLHISLIFLWSSSVIAMEIYELDNSSIIIQSSVDSESKIEAILKDKDQENIRKLDACCNPFIINFLLKNPTAKKCTNLNTLEIAWTSPTAEQLEKIIYKYPLLKNLNISGCHEGVRGLVASLQPGSSIPSDSGAYEDLNICDADVAPADICRMFEELCMLPNPAASSNELVQTIQCSQAFALQDLAMRYTDIKKEQMNYIIQKCSQLIALDIAGCKEAIQGLVESISDGYGKQLKKLIVSNAELTLGQLTIIIQNCLELEELDISFNDTIMDSLLSLLSQPNLQKLQTLDIRGVRYTAAQKKMLDEALVNCTIETNEVFLKRLYKK